MRGGSSGGGTRGPCGGRRGRSGHQPDRAELDAELAAGQAKLRQPLAESSMGRYKTTIKAFRDAMREVEAPIDDPLRPFHPVRKRSREQSPVGVAIAFVMSRCGFVVDERFGNNKARSTGGAIISAVTAAFNLLDCAECGPGFECRHVQGDYVELGEGRFRGNPGRAAQLKKVVKRLENDQARAKVNITERALAETHEDVQSLYNMYIKDVSVRVLRGVLPTKADLFDFKAFEACTLNVMQWGSVARADEILNLDLEDLVFPGSALDSPIFGVLPFTKTGTGTRYYKFSRGVHVSICPLHSLHRWLAVLMVHKIGRGPLFPAFQGGALREGVRMSHSTYRETLSYMSNRIGTAGRLTEHSARRGGAQYHHYVLGWGLRDIMMQFGWTDLQEMIKYLGIDDKINENPYDKLGFTCI